MDGGYIRCISSATICRDSISLWRFRKRHLHASPGEVRITRKGESTLQIVEELVSSKTNSQVVVQEI